MHRIFYATAALLFVAGPAFAQGMEGSPARDAPIMQALPDITKQTPTAVGSFVEGQVAGQLVASDLVGRDLYNTSGIKIGEIDDLFIDENGNVPFVVVDASELLGAKKKVAFAFGALGYQQAPDQQAMLVVALDRDALEKAPSFTSLADAAALEDSQGLTQNADEPRDTREPATKSVK